MIVAQALLFENGLSIVETADEQVESDEFSIHKTILSPIAHLLPLLLIRISYIVRAILSSRKSIVRIYV